MYKMKFCFLIIFFLISFEVNSKTSITLKLSCEYEPNLIEKKQAHNSSLESKKFDVRKVCETFACKDTVEVLSDNAETNGEAKYRLRNSWFNHQGILLDDFDISKNSITINTVVSNAYFLESYLIDRVTGKTERTFYRFDNPEFFYKINEIKKNKDNRRDLYNKNGRISLKTLKSFSLEPWQVFYFKGKCFEGISI